MPNLNKVMLMGNLTRDPEIKYTPKGAAIASFSMAINRYYTPEGGQRQEEVTFVEITAYGKQAETIGQHLKKGKALYVEGRLKLDTWDDKQTGQKRSKLHVVLEGFQFIAPKDTEDGQGGGDQSQGQDYSQGQGYGGYREPQGQRRGAPPARAPRPPADPDLDAAPDDIPF